MILYFQTYSKARERGSREEEERRERMFTYSSPSIAKHSEHSLFLFLKEQWLEDVLDRYIEFHNNVTAGLLPQKYAACSLAHGYGKSCLFCSSGEFFFSLKFHRQCVAAICVVHALCNFVKQSVDLRISVRKRGRGRGRERVREERRRRRDGEGGRRKAGLKV